jgi:hypothetical protein
VAGIRPPSSTLLARVDARPLPRRRCIGELAGNAVVVDGDGRGVSFECRMLATGALDESDTDLLRSGSEPSDAARTSV